MLLLSAIFLGLRTLVSAPGKVHLLLAIPTLRQSTGEGVNRSKDATGHVYLSLL